MNNYKIYGLSEPDGETIRYVGFTGQDLNKRYFGHYSQLNNPSYKTCWIKGLRMKGERPNMILIEDGLTKDEALQKEVHYIKMFKSFGAKLVNGTIGGEKGNERGRGRIVGNETREKLRQKSTGRKHSLETKKLIGEKSKGRNQSNEVRKKRSISMSKPVMQYDMNGNFVNEFHGKREAERKTGISPIGEVCRGKRKQAGGYIWKYKNN